jgi:hypothetical protein
MAAADFTRTEWGIVVGGTGTDATTVDTGRLRVKAMAFAGNADNATCLCTTLITTGTTAAAKIIEAIKFKTNANDLDVGATNMYFGERGIPMPGLAVTLSHANDRLYIYLV